MLRIVKNPRTVGQVKEGLIVVALTGVDRKGVATALFELDAILTGNVDAGVSAEGDRG